MHELIAALQRRVRELEGGRNTPSPGARPVPLEYSLAAAAAAVAASERPLRPDSSDTLSADSDAGSVQARLALAMDQAEVMRTRSAAASHSRPVMLTAPLHSLDQGETARRQAASELEAVLARSRRLAEASPAAGRGRGL
jgi:hypothetical protein